MSAVNVAGARFAWPVRVYYEDTDTTGVVYHAAYLAFMERARTEWLRAEGVNQERLRLEDDVTFTVSRIEVNYLAPARLDDELEVSVEVSKFGRASFLLNQAVEREGVPLCTATVRVACVSASRFRPRGLPQFLSQESLRGQ